VAHNHDIVALPGELVCVPDLVFDHRDTGERVYLEAFGFWSRQAVWQRVETIRRGGFPGRIILSVSKQLRVSQEVLDEEDAGELYVYRTTMRPQAILARLDGAAPAR
jgi:predicted nuclease of restriction endonuclease-like RecB superfamily